MNMNNSFTNFVMSRLAPPDRDDPWTRLLTNNDAGFNHTIAKKYAGFFEDNEVPPPGPDVMTFMTHTLLISIGIEKAGHRARILHACAMHAQRPKSDSEHSRRIRAAGLAARRSPAVSAAVDGE